MKFGLYRNNIIQFLLMCSAWFACTVVYGQDAEFIWAEDGQNSSRIVLSTFKDGAWQPGEKIIEDENWNLLPTLGADSGENKIAVWSTVEADRSLLKYTIKRQGQWLPAKILTDTLKTNLAPIVVFDSNDVCWVFWSANDDDDDDIFMSKFEAGVWLTPERVNSDNDVPDILPDAGMDNNNNIWVSWKTLTDDGYVTTSKSYSKFNSQKMARSQALSVQQIEQIKSRSILDHPIQPPPFFKSLSRASFYYPDDKKHPTRVIQGNLGS